MTERHWMSVDEAATAIAARTLSPVELTQALLDRIDKYDGRVNSFIQVDAERALQAARIAETEVLEGRRRGPLHGVPFGVKDIIDVAGIATTCHSKILADNIASSDATCIKLLRDAGAIVLGKLATYEFATGKGGHDLPWPPARNPWNTDHHPGGSSTGSGAAVAAGFVPMALGTDTGGSVRHPAGACGIVGLKPTYGLVSRHGVFPLSPPMDTIGPMTRNVADAALMLDAIAGHDPLDPATVGVERPKSSGADLDRGVRGLRIGFVRHFHEVDIPAHSEIAEGLEKVARAFAAEGAVVKDVQLPSLHDMGAATMVLLYSYGWATHAKWLRERPADYGEVGRPRLMTGAFLSADDLIRANRVRRQAINAVQAVFQDVDVLLCANMMDPACRMDQPDEISRTVPRQARTPFSLTSHPGIGMMSGLSKDGLPLSIQLVGRYFDEATLLRAARGWERVAGTDQQHPVLVASG